MKEKIKQIVLQNKRIIKLIILAIVIIGVVYLLFPKYYFIKDSSWLLRCNKITGQCWKYKSGQWESLMK